jgi:hypothetical protein
VRFNFNLGRMRCRHTIVTLPYRHHLLKAMPGDLPMHLAACDLMHASCLNLTRLYNDAAPWLGCAYCTLPLTPSLASQGCVREPWGDWSGILRYAPSRGSCLMVVDVTVVVVGPPRFAHLRAGRYRGANCCSIVVSMNHSVLIRVLVWLRRQGYSCPSEKLWSTLRYKADSGESFGLGTCVLATCVQAALRTVDCETMLGVGVPFEQSF